MSEKGSYRQILKSSSLMGGAAGINLVLGMLRAKCAAIFIGATGVGLLASLGSVQNLVATIAGLGIHSSAVRRIAEARAFDDEVAVGRSVFAIRRLSWLTGIVGMLAMIILGYAGSDLAIKDGSYSIELCFLGVAILLGNISGGQMALIQGSRRIPDMARAEILSALIGTTTSIAFYGAFGLRGIVPSIIATASLNAWVAWYFAQRLPKCNVILTWSQTFSEGRFLLSLGLAFMWSSLITAGVTYSIYALIISDLGVKAVGLYAAALSLSAMFVGFVLQSMGADFYPRLTSVASDDLAVNKMVNEQTEIGVLLVVPGLIFTASCSEWLLRLFYTKEFLPALSLIYWFVLGCMQRTISWPLGFVLRARGKDKLFAATETVFHGSHLFLVILAVHYYELQGVGLAFFVNNIFVVLIIYGVIKKQTGFKWDGNCKKVMLWSVAAVATSCMMAALLPLWPRTAVGLIGTTVTGIVCLREVANRVGLDHRAVRQITRIPGLGALIRIGGTAPRSN